MKLIQNINKYLSILDLKERKFELISLIILLTIIPVNFVHAQITDPNDVDDSKIAEDNEASSDEGEKTNKFEGSLRSDNIDDFDEDTVMKDLKDTTIGDFHDKTAIETPSDDTSRGDIEPNSAEVDDFNNDNNKNKDVHNEEKVVLKKI